MSQSNDQEYPDTAFQEYTNCFVQRLSRYATKPRGGSWRTVSGALSDAIVKAHLDGKLYAASLATWYPRYAILDIDDRSLEAANTIRAELGFNYSNSLLCASESPGSYHLLFTPIYGGKAPTVRLLHDAVGDAAAWFGVELYPQKHRMVRLPFGFGQTCLDPGLELLDWRALLYRFNKLEPFPIAKAGAELKKQTGFRAFSLPGNRDASSVFARGRSVLEYGLTLPGTRHESQFLVLYQYWYSGHTLENAKELTKRWIRLRHNGLSKEVQSGAWRLIDKEIERQADSLWESYVHAEPDQTLKRLASQERVTAQDVIQILVSCECNIAASNFLLRLISYCSIREAGPDGIPVHSDRLISFSSRGSYQDHIDRLTATGIIERGSYYKEGEESKSIFLSWSYEPASPPLLTNGEPPGDIVEAALLAFPQEQLLDKLREAKVDARSIRSFRIQLAKKTHAN